MKYLLVLLILAGGLFFLAGCSNNSGVSEASVADEPAAASSSQDDVEEQDLQRKLIKEGNVEFETDDPKRTHGEIYEAVKKFKGYVASDKEYSSSYRRSNVVIVRVPSKDFDSFLNDVTKGAKKIDRKEINTKDVTEEFLDVEARLKTKKELENRYLDLLKRASSVSEILEVEREIGSLRAEIESIEGRMQYLENKIAYSTLTITFYEEYTQSSRAGNRMKEGLKDGWDNFVSFFIALIHIWPFILIALGVLIGLGIYKKRR